MPRQADVRHADLRYIAHLVCHLSFNVLPRDASPGQSGLSLCAAECGNMVHSILGSPATRVGDIVRRSAEA